MGPGLFGETARGTLRGQRRRTGQSYARSVTDAPIEESPPRRSRAQLESWVREFEEQEHCIAGKITIPPQEDNGVDDTGLVILNLRNASPSIYMRPRGYDDPTWELTVTEQPTDLALSVHDIASLAAELVIASNLCTFLQYKSLDWDRRSGQHRAPEGGSRTSHATTRKPAAS